jgi:flagellar biosynthetic protein FliQ
MTESTLLDITRHAMIVALELSMPVLVVSLIVGMVVSLFQAITQIQEMTLTFVPKIIAVVLVVVLLGPWMLSLIVGFTSNMLGGVPSFLH